MTKIEEVARAMKPLMAKLVDSLISMGAIREEAIKLLPLDEARAAIEAMRTIDDAMMQAGVSADYGKTLGERITNTHNAMIDAALGEA